MYMAMRCIHTSGHVYGNAVYFIQSGCVYDIQWHVYCGVRCMPKIRVFLLDEIKVTLLRSQALGLHS